MTTVCIQCSMRALLLDEPPPVFNETPAEHARRCHPDAAATQRERAELERKLQEKLLADDPDPLGTWHGRNE